MLCGDIRAGIFEEAVSTPQTPEQAGVHASDIETIERQEVWIPVFTGICGERRVLNCF